MSSIDGALGLYEKDKYSASSQATRSSIEKTWLEYHEKATRMNPAIAGQPAFPMSATSFASIAALMKVDNFRSFGNYASWAKAQHISKGFDWTQQLELEQKCALRSVNRGLGVARQSASFDLDNIAAVRCDAPVKHAGQPVFPADLAVLGSLWVLREIEAAWAAVNDINVDYDNKSISWHLPVSKTDPRAKACTRSWGCLCSAGPETSCPFHRMVAYLRRLATFFDCDMTELLADYPLFPDYKGKVITKKGAVQGIVDVLSNAGVETVQRGGTQRFGGHTMRVTGSRYWTGRGLEVFKVQIFARWGSSVILRYVSDVPIANLTGDLNRTPASCAVGLHSPPTQPVPALLEKFIEDALQQVEALKAEVERLSLSIEPSYVQNTSTHAWHRVLRGGSQYPPALWKTCCGWHFAILPHRLSATRPATGTAVCKNQCFPKTATTTNVPMGSLSSSDSGSSD